MSETFKLQYAFIYPKTCFYIDRVCEYINIYAKKRLTSVYLLGLQNRGLGVRVPRGLHGKDVFAAAGASFLFG